MKNSSPVVVFFIIIAILALTVAGVIYLQVNVPDTD